MDVRERIATIKDIAKNEEKLVAKSFVATNTHVFADIRLTNVKYLNMKSGARREDAEQDDEVDGRKGDKKKMQNYR